MLIRIPRHKKKEKTVIQYTQTNRVIPYHKEHEHSNPKGRFTTNIRGKGCQFVFSSHFTPSLKPDVYLLLGGQIEGKKVSRTRDFLKGGARGGMGATVPFQRQGMPSPIGQVPDL